MVLCALGGFLVASLDKTFSLLGIGVAVACLFIAGSTLSTATQLADSLRASVKRSVRVSVWGLALPPSAETIFEIDSISAFGAGLLIYLRAMPGGTTGQLKIAQPRSAHLTDDRLEIGEAAYISWSGRNLARAADTKTPALTLIFWHKNVRMTS